MYFEQFYLTCLAHASYMVGSEGEAAVVDPQRDVDIYLKVAEEQNLRIRYIFETHLHADFVSGHKELAARTGAKIYIGAQANAEFPHVRLTDGFEVKMGAVRIRALETPGHTPESVCLVITDVSKSSEGESVQPCAVLTGDTLFIGDVGRRIFRARTRRGNLRDCFMTACTRSCWRFLIRWWCIRRTGRARCADAPCGRSARPRLVRSG
jgi:glyoxylase-like metal-dependent hydrolase (beta-lactamase superfamily II)